MTAEVPASTGGEMSVDLTPGEVWTESQLAVIRHLVTRVHTAEAERDELARQVGEVRGEILAMFCAWEIGPEARDRLSRALGDPT